MKAIPPRQEDRQWQDPRQQALESAFRLLARRDHTRRELEVKLRQKGLGQSDIAGALARCDELGFLDDAKTAMTMAGHLVDKGYGILRIRHALGQKGLDDASIEKASTCCGDEKDQVRCARRALQKKRVRLGREPDPVKRRQMAYRFLAGRGFPATVIRRALDDSGDGIL
jgi:regulatory protein